MLEQFVLQMVNEGLVLVLLLSGPPVLLALLVGLLVSLGQAVTQVQEATLSFVPKAVVVFGTLAVLGSTLGEALVRFGRVCLQGFPGVLGR